MQRVLLLLCAKRSQMPHKRFKFLTLIIAHLSRESGTNRKFTKNN